MGKIKMPIEDTVSILIAVGLLLVAVIFVSVLLTGVFTGPVTQMPDKQWSFSHCTPTNKNCGRLD